MKKRLSLLVCFLMVVGFCCAAPIVRITGKVMSQSTGAPLEHVLVIDAKSHVILTETDADGRFAINFHDGGTLRFQLIGVEPVTLKLKNGQTYVEVRMADLDVDLDEAVVTAKRNRKKIMPEPTDIEVRGNYLHIRTRVRVPAEIFNTNTRLVVQPILNDVSDKRSTLMRPLVFDGEEYHYTQTRMYDFKLEGRDPLAPYTGVRSKATRERNTEDHNDIIGYADSIYVQDVHHDYSCDVFMALEDYQKIFYRDMSSRNGTIINGSAAITLPSTMSIDVPTAQAGHYLTVSGNATLPTTLTLLNLDQVDAKAKAFTILKVTGTATGALPAIDPATPVPPAWQLYWTGSELKLGIPRATRLYFR